jgi:hypothetical protein
MGLILSEPVKKVVEVCSRILLLLLLLLLLLPPLLPRC